MRVTIVESPYNLASLGRSECVRYALWCCVDCDERGEASFASHLFFTQFIPETKDGRDRGLAYRDEIARRAGDTIARYTDIGETSGMYRPIDGTNHVTYRKLEGDIRRRWMAGEWPPGSLRPQCA